MRARELLDKRKNMYLTLVAIGFAIIVVLAFTEKYMPTQLFKAMLYGAISLFLVGNILLYVGIRCPKCKAILGYHIVFSAGQADQCPRCRSSFDENIQ